MIERFKHWLFWYVYRMVRRRMLKPDMRSRQYHALMREVRNMPLQDIADLQRARYIYDVWNMLEMRTHGQKSTEWMMAMTSEMCRCDVAEVAEALDTMRQRCP